MGILLLLLLALVSSTGRAVVVSAAAAGDTGNSGQDSQARQLQGQQQPRTLGLHTYHGSAKTLRNPDRGFRGQLGNWQSVDPSVGGGHRDLCHVDGPEPADLEALSRYNLSVAQAYCFLPAAEQQLSEAFLGRVSRGFAALRAHGAKALLRFL